MLLTKKWIWYGFLDRPENFQTIQKPSRLSGNYPHCEHGQIIIYQQARKPRSYASRNYDRVTHSQGWSLDSRATSEAKNWISWKLTWVDLVWFYQESQLSSWLGGILWREVNKKFLQCYIRGWDIENVLQSFSGMFSVSGGNIFFSGIQTSDESARSNSTSTVLLYTLKLAALIHDSITSRNTAIFQMFVFLLIFRRSCQMSPWIFFQR